MSGIVLSGGMALGLVSLGVLLLFVECNRPGTIIPGAGGLLLLLLGAHRLWAVPGRSTAVVGTAFAGLAAIAVLRWRSVYGLPGVLGTALLTGAAAAFARNSGGQVRVTAAVMSSLLLGSIASFLVLIAGRAWRAKSGHQSASAERARTGAAEWWGE